MPIYTCTSTVESSSASLPVYSRERAITMRCIILSVFRSCCARAYEQKRQKMFPLMTCAARRREILARSRSRRHLRKITVDANTARSMRRLCSGGKHSEREWPTHITVRRVRGRDEMNVIDDDKNFIVSHGPTSIPGMTKYLRHSTRQRITPKIFKGRPSDHHSHACLRQST